MLQQENKRSKTAAFTLVELIVSMMVAAILLVVAVPGFYDLIQNNKISTIANKLSASFNYARMEAIKRGTTVSVCSAANAAANTCGSAAQWRQGWIIFTDPNNNNAIDSTNDLMSIHEALPLGSTAAATAGLVAYDANGFVSSGAFTIDLGASGCTGNHGRRLNLSASGRLSISQRACP